MYYVWFVLTVLGLRLLIIVLAIYHARFLMERRARSLLALHPAAEQTSVYLKLHSTWPRNKQREIDTKIAEMKARGWTFLRAKEANPLRTIRSWGGGLMLCFIRTNQ